MPYYIRFETVIYIHVTKPNFQFGILNNRQKNCWLASTNVEYRIKLPDDLLGQNVMYAQLKAQIKC